LLGPIFNREFLTVPRRSRHYALRVAYLGTLWIIAVTAWLATVGWQRSATLGETARLGQTLFQVLMFVQLALFLFFAALSSASAIAQEKDRRTFVLLLMTDMRNHEIVLGKMLGSLLPIGLLLAATVPLWMMLLLLGGVAPRQVFEALLVIAATSLAAGSLGGLIALWRERTFQSLALTVLCLVFYLGLVRVAGVLPALTPLSERDVGQLQRWLDPFLALASTQELRTASATGVAPAYGFTAVMLLWAALLNGVGLWKLRVWNPSGEPIMQREKVAEKAAELEEKDRVAAHAAPGMAREVGENPILWREIFTRAYGRRPLLVKLAYFIVLAFICYPALAPFFGGGKPPDFAAAYGLIPVGVLSLLLIAAQATTAITSERDTGALDLLLVTDLTPKEFIFGKLGGIAYNTKEFIVPPLILAGVYAWYGALATPPAGHPEMRAGMNVLSLICLVGDALVLLAFAMVLGVHVALRTQNSRLAITNALSTIFFLSAGTLVCIALIIINRRFEYQWGSFVFFIVAGIGGLWWVLNGDRPAPALLIASIACPLAVLYTVMNILVAKPGSEESADPILPFLVIAAAFGFTVTAMLVPLLSEFDVALGRTSGGAD
jgi:ABC-type transport system involved in multi-copper enzyme maturation permease subunit